jgi:hypothetical protein
MRYHDMEDNSRLHELHKRITREIAEERKQEIHALKASKQRRRELAEKQDERESLETAGLNFNALEKLERERAQQAEKELRDIKSQMEEQSQEVERDEFELDVGSGFLPEGAKQLTPVWIAGFSDDDGDSELAAASALAPQAVLTGGGCQNWWNWAKGGGWGCTDGTGSNQQWAEFGFWFRPSVSKFYSIIPYIQYRGFYIVRANDEWYNCKSAQVRISQWVNVHQYNWKGWKSENVLDVSSQNINVNKRFDDNRTMYTSYLLGGGDWAFIRCTIGLYVRAQGDGSYAENNFSTGNANHLCVPYCYVY